MTISLVPAPPFRGLNLRDQPDMLEPGQALDLMDVITSERPRVQKRPVFGRWFPAASAASIRSMQLFEHTDGTVRTLISEDLAARAIVTGVGPGGSEASILHSHVLTDYVRSYARYGQPNSERVYLANGVDTMRRYEKAGFTAPTVSVVNGVTGAVSAGVTAPRPGALGVWAGENRLVLGAFRTATGGPNGAVTSPDHVWISEPGDPERFRDDAFLRLSPGDGDAVQAVIAWRDLVFVFKRRKFFILATSRQDNKANPIFDYRTVDAGVGAVGPFAVAAGTDGVYFVADNGVYRTQGGEPELISELVGPLFTGEGAPFFTGGLMSLDQRATSTRLAWCDERLCMAYRHAKTQIAAGAQGMDRMAVVDLRTGEWVVWQFCEGLAFQALGVTRSALAARDRFAVGYGNDVYLYNRPDLAITESTLGGFSGRWLGAYDALGIEQIKRVPRLAIWGSGEINVGLRTDFHGRDWTKLVQFDDTGDVWDDGNWDDGRWGGAAVLAGRLVRRASRGARVAIDLEGTKLKGWSVSRVVQHVAGTRRPPDVNED